jgi:hypothetical protein
MLYATAGRIERSPFRKTSLGPGDTGMTSRAAYSRPQSFPIENTPNSLRRPKNKTERSYKKENDTVKTDETKSATCKSKNKRTTWVCPVCLCRILFSIP